MLMKVGQIVKSTSGRDQGRFYVILSEKNGWFYLADGKLHKQAAPKKKKNRHKKAHTPNLDAQKPQLKDSTEQESLMKPFYLTF